MPPERRRVILDEDVSRKLARELVRRGRIDATTAYDEKIDKIRDGAVLKALAERYEPCILVTFDNKMTTGHAAEIKHHGNTIAVVNKKAFSVGDNYNEDAYIRDVIHRWLHQIEFQPPKTTRLYSRTAMSRIKRH